MKHALNILRVELAKNIERRKQLFSLPKDLHIIRRDKLIEEEAEIRAAIKKLSTP